MAGTATHGRAEGFVRALAAVLLVGIAGGPARAAEPPRKAPAAAAKEADLGAKKSAAPDASLGGTLAAKKPSAAAAGPTLDFDTFRRGVEVNISGKRREEIAGLQKLIKLGGGSDEDTPQWYYRLAELFWEESQYYFFEANRRDDRLIELGTRGDPAEIDRLTAEKKALDAEQKKLQAQSVALYKAIIQRYPNYPRLDEVLYFLAQNLQRRDRMDPDALKAYRALIQRYPKSRYVPDSWMAFGEYYFERANKNDRPQNLGKALESYKRAAEYQESSVYGYALYKQGWVHYNLGNWSEALELFRAVIFFGEMPTTTVAQDRKLALVKEARKDFVRTYSHVGSAERAYDEFRRVGGEAGWWDMLKTLAGLYYDEGKDRDAILVYARLIRERPASVDAPFFQSHIVTCAARMGRKDAAVAQAHVFVKMLQQIEASPEGKDPKNAKALADARADAERTLRILAVQYHNEWKKTRDEPVAGYAAEVYRDYLQVFPNEQPAYEMRFFHAELLYALAQFPEAGAEYERVAEADLQATAKGAKPGRFFKDALENTVFAYDVVAKRLDESGQKVPAGDAKKRIPFAPARQKLVEACERYLKHQPKGEKWVEIAYKAARLHYQHNAFGEASDLFTRIALDHPAHELAEYSANLVLDAYNLLGDWRNVNGWAKRFYANKALVDAHPRLKDDLTRIIEGSAFRVIQEREQAKDWDGATDEYLAFARDWPQSQFAATALYNAAVNQVRAGRLDRAMEIRDQFLRRYADDQRAPEVLFDNAEAFEALGDFAEAAARYERYFAGWRDAARPTPRGPARPARGARGRGRAAAVQAEAKPAEAASRPRYDEKKAIDAIINAAVFRAGLRDWARAEADSLAYLEIWPNGADAPRIFLSLADLYARRGQTQKELAQLEEYQRKYAKDPDEWLAIQERMAKLYAKAGNGALARRLYEQGLAYARARASKVDDRGLSLVAQAELMALEPEFAKYQRITLNVAPKYLKGQLQVKAKKLAELEAEYGKIVKRKQAEPAVCALHRIGLGYTHFARAFLDNPIPKDVRALGREAVDEYKAQLAQVVEQFGWETKAAEAYGLAVNASREYGITNSCSREAAEALKKVKPDAARPSVEIAVPIAAVAAADAPAGYGLLAEIQPQPAPRAAGAREPALPALRVKPAGTQGQGTADGDPQRRALDPDQPIPPRKRRGTDDEDLLP